MAYMYNRIYMRATHKSKWESTNRKW